jgi:hypothetical protein
MGALFLSFAGIASWAVILVTGTQPVPLAKTQTQGLGLLGQMFGFFYLLTERNNPVSAVLVDTD